METKFVFYSDGIVGQGRVHSTVTDLLKWDRALYTDKLLSAEGMRVIFEVAILENKSKTEYGFGWHIEESADFGKIVNHSGSWPGYATFIDRHVANDKTIILLANRTDFRPRSVNPIVAIRSILYNKPLVVK